jgi:hypothetical protein
MRTITNAATTVMLFTLAACQSSSPSTTTQTQTETTDDTNDADSDESVTLTTQGQDSTSTDGPTTEPTGITEPTDTTADPSADSTGTTTDDPGTETTDPGESSTTESVDDTTTGDMPGNTIYEVQDGTIPEGTPVEIYSVVVTAVTGTGFFAQEPAGGEYSGVIVFSGNGGPDTSAVEVGDIVDFSGNTFEFNDAITEVVITDGTFNIVGPGNPLDPEIVDISAFGNPDTAEPWEAVLVRVEGDLVVTEVVTMFDEVVVTDGDSVTIDNFLYNLPDSGDFAGLDVDASFTAVQGPVNFWIDDYKIAPRSMDDVEGYQAP